MAENNSSNNGNEEVPQWLAALRIKKGEWMIDSKVRWRKAMKARCFCPAARIYACLGLHTMAFQQELAVKMEAGKRVPLTPQDISAETGVGRKHVREAIVELKHWGLADVKGSTKGRVEMYAWASPRAVEVEKIVPSRGTIFDLPEPLKPFIPLYKKLKIAPPEAFVTSRGYQMAVEEAARRYQEAEMVLARTLKGLGATEDDGGEDVVLPSPETERNERNILKETPPPPPPQGSSVNGKGPAPPKPAEQPKQEEEEGEVSFKTFQKLYPKQRLDAAKAAPLFAALKYDHKDQAIAWLKLNYDCPRWRADGGKWIPWASTFLREKQFGHAPPPAFQPRGVNGIEQKAADYARRRQQEERDAGD